MLQVPKHGHYAYECPNKKIMLLKDNNGEIELTSEHEKDEGEVNSSGEKE